MLDRDQLETFAAVVEQGGFERAATTLNITRGAVSQRVKALEESLAQVLLVRRKPVATTPAGDVLLRHVKAMRLLEAAALDALVPPSDARTPVPLAIAVNADSLATWFPRVIWPLLVRPRIALEVVTDDQDHTESRLARGEVIGCVSTRSRPSTGFVAEALGAMEYRCVATPEFTRRHFATGLTLAAVLQAPAVLFNRKDSLHDDFLAGLFGFRVEQYTRHYLPAPGALLEGVAAGIGYGLVPSLQLADAQRELVDLAPQAPVLVDLYWHRWDMEPPLSQEITRRVVDEAGRVLVPSTLRRAA